MVHKFSFQSLPDGPSKQCKIILVKSEVPQGTVLGPILFLLFINNMTDCLKHSLAGMFADDTRILRKISGVDDTLLLQEDLLNIAKWSQENNIELNKDKFQFMSHKLKKKTF